MLGIFLIFKFPFSFHSRFALAPAPAPPSASISPHPLLDFSGTVRTIAAASNGTNSFIAPSGVAVDTTNNCVWVADAGAHRVLRVTRNSPAQVTTVAGSAAALPSTTVLRPSFISSTANANLTLSTSNTVATLVGIVSPSGVNAILLSPPTAADGYRTITFKQLGSAGAMLGFCAPFVTTATVAAHKVANAGVWIDATTGALIYPRGTRSRDSDDDDDDHDDKKVKALSSGATLTLKYRPSDGKLTATTSSSSESETLVDEDLAADLVPCVLFSRAASVGVLQAVADGDGVGTSASFSSPSSLVAAGSVVYIADTGSNRIARLTTSSGLVTFVCGSSMAPAAYAEGSCATAARLNAPGGLAFHSARNLLYFIDQGNNRVRVLAISSLTTSLIAGSGVAGAADSSSGSRATFNAMTSLALHPNGAQVRVRGFRCWSRDL